MHKENKKIPLTFPKKSYIMEQHSEAIFYNIFFQKRITQMHDCLFQARDSIAVQLEMIEGRGDSIFVYYHMVLWAMLAFCALKDVREYRIPNGAVFIGIMAGLLEAVGVGLALGFLGRLVLVVFLAFPAFLLGMVGAGDVKMMALIAAWQGLAEGALAIGIGLCLGAVLALGKMLRQGSIYVRFRYFILYIRNIIQKKEISLYYDKSRDGRECVIPLGACFCAGTLIMAVWKSR